MKRLISIAIAVIFSLQLHAQVKIDRTKTPKSGPAPLIFLKKPVITKLSNGLTLLVVEDHRLPKVSARFLGNTGLINEVDKAGLMNITYAMLNEGTLSIPKAKFDETLDLTGSTLKFTATEVNLSALTRHFDVALRLMAKAITEPALEQKALDKIKAQQITQLQLQVKNTTFLAEQLTNVLAYGKTHPKGELTRSQTIQNILLRDVKDAYKKHIVPQGSYLVVIGDITPEAASQLAQKFFFSWKGNLVSYW
jgi:zinc protease